MSAASVGQLRDPFERLWDHHAAAMAGDAGRPGAIDLTAYAEPEDRGRASLSDLGAVEYVEDLIRPGRIVVWAAEEGSGKSFSVAGELAIRVAVAGGEFAGIWKVRRRGAVLVLSEMHADDDHVREDTVLASLGLTRANLAETYFRLPLAMAAGGRPALTDETWRSAITDWLRYRRAILLVVDTATGATRVDPWGEKMQEVFHDLRVMLASYPALAIVLVVHVRKPTGKGDRRISDVLGEWGRWCDVVVLQENEGADLERTKLSVRKRVRQQRRIVATKAGGLLIDSADAESGGPKVPTAKVLEAIAEEPGLTYARLGELLEVSKDTASRYAKDLGEKVRLEPTGPRKAIRIFIAAPPQTTASEPAAVGHTIPSNDRRTAARTYIGAAVLAAVDEGAPNEVAPDSVPWDEDLAERASDDDAEVGW